MAGILIFKAREALTKNHRTHRDVALPSQGGPSARGPRVARPPPTVLRETYLTFAKWTSAIAIIMRAVALLFSLIGM